MSHPVNIPNGSPNFFFSFSEFMEGKASETVCFDLYLKVQSLEKNNRELASKLEWTERKLNEAYFDNKRVRKERNALRAKRETLTQEKVDAILGPKTQNRREQTRANLNKMELEH